MPYWSVQDWRARIGSSWSVMGHKPKKSDVKRSKEPIDHNHQKKSDVKQSIDQMKWKYMYFFILTLLLGNYYSTYRCFDTTLQISNGTEFSSNLHTLSVEYRSMLGWSYFVVTGFQRRMLWNSNQLENSLHAYFNLQVLLFTTAMILRSGDIEPNPGPGMRIVTKPAFGLTFVYPMVKLMIQVMVSVSC